MNYNYFPQNYPYGMNNPYQQQLQQIQQNNNAQNNQTLFMRAKSIDDAKQYPLAPNTTAIFITEDNNICCLKSLGTNPFDTPNFIIYQRQTEKQQIINDEVKEEVVQKTAENYATKQELNSYIEQFNIIGNNFAILKKESDELKEELNKLKSELGVK